MVEEMNSELIEQAEGKSASIITDHTMNLEARARDLYR